MYVLTHLLYVWWLSEHCGSYGFAMLNDTDTISLQGGCKAGLCLAHDAGGVLRLGNCTDTSARGWTRVVKDSTS
jgi:hypothetical protein